LKIIFPASLPYFVTDDCSCAVQHLNDWFVRYCRNCAVFWHFVILCSVYYLVMVLICMQWITGTWFIWNS